MNKHDQNGSINILLIQLIMASLAMIGTAAFAIWAYNSRQDYKNNVESKITTAVTVAKTVESSEKDKQFAELEKKPLRTYNGPQAFGSLVLQYPKTWSAYIDDTGSGAAPVDGYFYPGYVPSITNPNSSFALRVQVLPQSYSSVLASLRGQETAGQIQIAPYTLPSVTNVIGIRVDGKITPGKDGTMIVLPLRDKSIEISTQGSEFSADFEENILKNLTFSP